MTLVALKSNADIGSPKYLILLGFFSPKAFPDITGAPKVLLCIIPYGLLPSFLYFFSKAKLTLPPKE